ncbi:MAG: methyltransferase domain-containing protein [Gaiellaceae bacterium]
MSVPDCRSCGTPLEHTFIDLGEQPLSNGFLTPEQLEAGDDPHYPLHVRVCSNCLLVQADQVVPADAIFNDTYAYFSSYSQSWLDHAARYSGAATERLGLDESSLVIEVASNDGYLLKTFAAAGIPVLGVEPAANAAEVALTAGIPTEIAFFGHDQARALVERGDAADLVVGNNVFAHVPALRDFVAGLEAVLKPEAVISIEAPHLLRMIERVEFDTIYHEHFSYYSLLAARDVLRRGGLRVFDVEELSTHGGSLRIWASRDAAADAWPETTAVERVLEEERAAGLDSLEGYGSFAPRVERLLEELRGFLAQAKADGKRVAAYAAAAKGNTLLNSAGVSTDEIAYVVDRSPHKQGLFLPGSHLPVLDPEHVREDRPDYLLLLAWNLRDEIVEQMAHVREWGGQFVVPVPSLQVIA